MLNLIYLFSDVAFLVAKFTVFCSVVGMTYMLNTALYNINMICMGSRRVVHLRRFYIYVYICQLIDILHLVSSASFAPFI